MAKDGSGFEKRLEAAMPKDAPPNGDARPGWRVSEMQAKLHRWAAADPGRQFDDLFATLGPGRLNKPTAGTMESPLRGDAHGGFGERPGETDQQQCRHRAPGRLIRIGERSVRRPMRPSTRPPPCG
jgi:hypothetical protein